MMGLWKYASQLMKWSHLAKPGEGVPCAIRFIVCLSSNYDFITEGGIGMESDIKKGASGWLSRCRTRMRGDHLGGLKVGGVSPKGSFPRISSTAQPGSTKISGTCTEECTTQTSFVDMFPVR